MVSNFFSLSTGKTIFYAVTYGVLRTAAGPKITAKKGKVMQAMSLLFQQKKKSITRQTIKDCFGLPRCGSGSEPVIGEVWTLV